MQVSACQEKKKNPTSHVHGTRKGRRDDGRHFACHVAREQGASVRDKTPAMTLTATAFGLQSTASATLLLLSLLRSNLGRYSVCLEKALPHGTFQCSSTCAWGTPRFPFLRKLGNLTALRVKRRAKQQICTEEHGMMARSSLNYLV